MPLQPPASNALDISPADARESERRVLREIVQSLSAEERDIYIRAAYGLPKEQIASWSGRSADEVHTLVTRIRQRIREACK